MVNETTQRVTRPSSSWDPEPHEGIANSLEMGKGRQTDTRPGTGQARSGRGSQQLRFIWM